VNKKILALGTTGLGMLAIAAVGLLGWHSEYKRAEKLAEEVTALQKQEKQSAVMRSVSKQMEEIALQQKDISDEQREEAIQQKRTADEMRHRSEEERMKALVAQDNAIHSEHKAQEARQIAESERQMAEHQRIQAELSKRVADTLSYVALSRSLGSLSSTQAQLGNSELADLLAISAYHYTKRYGSVYDPAVFQALMKTSQSMHSWPRHNGALMNLAFMSQTDNRIVSISNYGEILIHKKVGDQLQSTTLFSDKAYDFRDLIIDDGIIYAISRSGHLVILEKNMPRVVTLPELPYPMGITKLDDNSLLIACEQGLAVYDKYRKMIVSTRELDFHLTIVSRYNNQPCLFDDQGRQHIVLNINDLKTSAIPVIGKVTAFASSKNTKTQAFGMNDGTIYLYNEISDKVTKLQGHFSRISKLKLNGQQLFSSSYDGKVNLWNTSSEKIEPMTLLSAGSWIMNFTFDGSKEHAWIGDQNGNLTEAVMSVPIMANMLSNKLKRDFTTEEWNYYLGKNVPYVSFKNIGK